MNLNPDQFRMVTNIKAAPNSQGTLFQGGPRPNQRWPRGFSPQRRDDVLAAMNDFGPSGYDPHGNPKNLYGGSKGVADPNPDVGMLRRETVEGVHNLARSTVPTSAMRGARYGFGQSYTSGRVFGSYSPSEGTYGTPSIWVGKGYAGDATVIHETGHHVSRVARNASSFYNTPRRRGKEEARAENYAEEHYRGHPGKGDQRYDSWHFPGDWAHEEETPERQKQFTDAYMGERRKSPAAARRQAADRTRPAPNRQGVLF